MDWTCLRTWYQDLEPRTAWCWLGAAVLAAVLLCPWRRAASVEATVRAKEGQTYPLLAPGPGQVREVRAEKDAVLAAVPAQLARELRSGMPATLEVDAWLHDAETIQLVLEKVGNRNLEPAEVSALVSRALRDETYVLVTCAPVRAESRLFPPPGNCRVHLAGVRRCLLERMLF